MGFIYVANVVPIHGTSFATKTINLNGKSSQKRQEAACRSKLLRLCTINLYMQRTSNVPRTRYKFKNIYIYIYIYIYILIYEHITDQISFT